MAAILLFKGHKGPASIPACGAAGRAVEHEGKQALGFRFIRQECDEEAGSLRKKAAVIHAG